MWSGRDHFLLRQRRRVKEGLRWCLAEAPSPLMRPFLVVFLPPTRRSRWEVSTAIADVVLDGSPTHRAAKGISEQTRRRERLARPLLIADIPTPGGSPSRIFFPSRADAYGPMEFLGGAPGKRLLGRRSFDRQGRSPDLSLGWSRMGPLLCYLPTARRPSRSYPAWCARGSPLPPRPRRHPRCFRLKFPPASSQLLARRPNRPAPLAPRCSRLWLHRRSLAPSPLPAVEPDLWLPGPSAPARRFSSTC